jgi:O-acetyl-ADP-ribose deacetylase (regulator of RNase III)
MELEVNDHKLKLITGDISKQQADAIVNAANGTLLGGGGVDGAIHRAAGKELLAECKRVRDEQLHGEELATGEAVLTGGHSLPAAHVIHTVGPVWGGNERENEDQLARCYSNALEIAADRKFSRVCFPSISTGVYRFPLDRASTIAIETITDFLKNHAYPKEVIMVLFSEEDMFVYERALNKL